MNISMFIFIYSIALPSLETLGCPPRLKIMQRINSKNWSVFSSVTVCNMQPVEPKFRCSEPKQDMYVVMQIYIPSALTGACETEKG